MLVYYEKYDEAEELYIKLERKDLAINMRVKIGDWFRVLTLAKEGTGHDNIL